MRTLNDNWALIVITIFIGLCIVSYLEGPIENLITDRGRIKNYLLTPTSHSITIPAEKGN